jgi:UDP-glucuronate 4-epimerase
MKVLVTGGAGFIGSHVIKDLLARGYTVVSIDNMNDYYDPSLKYTRLNHFKDQIEHIEIDISDTSAVEEVFKRHTFDAVCHLAAQAGVRYSIENPFVYAHSNYIGTLNIFEFAKRYNVKHVVAAATSSVYGLNDQMPFHEDQRVDTPISIYSATKRATELLAHTYHHLFNMNITMLRFFTVYGPWGRPDMALALFTKAIIAGEPIKVFNNGNMKRDFTYVDDIVSGVVAALERPKGLQIYNLANGTQISLMEYIQAIEGFLGKKAVLDLQPMQPGDVQATWADISKAKRDLGYNPRTNVIEGIKKYIEWYKSYYAEPERIPNLKKTFLITGGAGFIGINLTERLLRDGYKVIVVDDLSGGKAESIPEGVPLYRLDICKTEPLTALMQGVDVVVHLAALPRVQFSIEHPFEAQRVNNDGTLSVLEAARAAKVKRVIFAASSAVYGDQEVMPLTEGMPAQPKSPYGLHKYYGEMLMKLWADMHNMETVSLRFFNVYGPHGDPDRAYALAIDKFLKQRRDGKPITVTGDGQQTRDFTHVSDTVDAIVRASVSDRVGKGEVFNVGTGRNVTMNEIARLIGGPVEYIAPRIEPKHTLADSSYINLVLGWSPVIKIEEGIAQLKKQFGLE